MLSWSNLTLITKYIYGPWERRLRSENNWYWINLEINYPVTNTYLQEALDYLANNLTTKVEKLNLGGQIYLEDKHVNSLVIRCNKIVALNLGLTSITENCLNSISENLNLSLEELDLSEYINPITCAEIYWHLRSISKLKILNLPNLIHCLIWA